MTSLDEELKGMTRDEVTVKEFIGEERRVNERSYSDRILSTP